MHAPSPKIIYRRGSRRRPTVAKETNAHKPASVWTVILTDAHFWVPAIVLIAGLLVLQWIR
jgi:hypothetical protein